MSYHGDIAVGSTVYLPYFTCDIDLVPATITGGAVAVYKDNSTTQSTAGVTLTTDFDSVTGQHLVTITTFSDPMFYSAGGDFTVRFSAGTVDGVSIAGRVIGSFSIQNRYPSPAIIADEMPSGDVTITGSDVLIED